MSKLSIDSIKKLLSEITPGSWTSERGYGYDIYSAGYFIGSTKGNDHQTNVDLKNAEFIAAAPDVVRFLLNEREELKLQLHKARTLWCDSKRNPETGYVDIKYLDEFEKSISLLGKIGEWK